MLFDLVCVSQVQTVLDAPFVKEKALLFSPVPYEYNYFLYCKETSMSAKCQLFREQSPIYLESYLYNEPLYERIRLIRTLEMPAQNGLEDRSHSFWTKDGDQWNVYKDSLQTTEIQWTTPVNFNVQIPYDVRQYLGINVRELMAIESKWDMRKHHYESYYGEIVKHYIQSGLLEIDEEGFLRKIQEFTPDSFELMTLVELIRSVYNTGHLDSYSDVDFYYPHSEEQCDSIQELLNGESKISFRTKEDYYIDELTGDLRSSIIGLAVVLDDAPVGEELYWIYYPALKWACLGKCCLHDGEVMDVETVFSDHLLADHIESREKPSYVFDATNDFEYSVKLEPLLAIDAFLEISDSIGDGYFEFEATAGRNELHFWMDGTLAEGEIKEFYENGQERYSGQMTNGKCDGYFTFYYPEGGVKAKRFFADGKPRGEQLNYYANGNLYAVYEVDENEIITSLRRFYDDGTLMESGEFRDGVPVGPWLHITKCSKEMFELLTSDFFLPEWKIEYEESLKGFEFTVNYTHEFANDCPPNTSGKLKEQLCLKPTFVPVPE
jgi:antitoxin component YwqK of YwqJK toxin-antitoxin module